MSSTVYQETQQVSVEEFASIFRDYPAGVAVVTADPGDGPVALVASSLSSLSAAPAYVSFSVSDATTAAPAVGRARTVVLHIFDADNIDFVRHVARSGSDRFSDTERWTRLPSGEPLFHGTRGWLRGEVEQRIRVGTATLNVVRILETGRQLDVEAHRPLVYHDRTWHAIGAHSRVEA